MTEQKTIFYKLNIKGIKCLLQMHLYEDRMFFAQIQLRDASSRIREEFLKLFQMKYGVGSLQWRETVEDQLGNKIALKDDVVPKALFFSGD